MSVVKHFFDKFFHQSLRLQILIVVASLLLIPILIMFYDIFFASKSDQIMLLDHEGKLKTAVESKIVPGIKEDILKEVNDLDFNSLGPDQKAHILESAFNNAAGPLAADFPGVRFGLYILGSEQIFVQGFLHQYRPLSPDEVLEREKRIMNEADSGLIAVIASERPLARLTSSLRDETYEYLTPVFINNRLVAVVWADERLHPIFAQSRSFLSLTKYIALLVLFVGAAGALLVIHNLASSVSSVKIGLKEMEKDLTRLLPEIPGEAGEIAMAINKMAVSLAEKERLEYEMQRSERLASLGRLVTGVAHELRNPIGVVKASVQVMEKEYSQTPGMNEYITVIKEQIDRQNRVIQELLDFGRPSKEMIQPVNINSLMEKVLTFTLPMLTQSDIRLEVSFATDLPKILADPSRIKQVFVNLILNSIQAMPAGGDLFIKTHPGDDSIYAEFKDSGQGINPDDLPRIFDPFYTTKETGTGLGLSISHQIIRSHNGTIHVRSIPGEGTVFKVILPIFGEQGGVQNGTQNTDH
ncbi:MAG: histidine kinase [Peptococcaceae bacterium BICA1-7]|nr:MAG: histidine kinase [Peptococcaceae bacterium BICA1-7]HBV97336.1 two-component sensor histidine kinase [Desulfotomaculum sp.]